MSAMDTSDDEQFFISSPIPTTAATPNVATPKTPSKPYDLSDSEDDDNLDTNSRLDSLNISSTLKNMLRYSNFNAVDDDDDDDEDDNIKKYDNSLFATPSILKTPGALESLIPKKDAAQPNRRLTKKTFGTKSLLADKSFDKSLNNDDNENENENDNKSDNNDNQRPQKIKKTRKKKSVLPKKKSGNAEFKAILAKVMQNNASSSGTESEGEKEAKALLEKKAVPNLKKKARTLKPKKKTPEQAEKEQSQKLKKAVEKRLAKGKMKAVQDNQDNSHANAVEDEDEDGSLFISTEPGQVEPLDSIMKLLKKKPNKANNEQLEPDLPHTAGASNFLFLDSDDDESENENENKRRSGQKKKSLSKKAILEMRREAERSHRSIEVKLQPKFKKKTFSSFFDLIDNQSKNQSRLDESIGQDSLKEKESNLTPNSTKLPNHREPQNTYSDSDSDLEIIGGPKSTPNHLLLSPQRNPVSTMAWSPVHNSRTTHRDLNKQLQERIAREMLERRKQMEEKARARGSYTSPEERAKQILEREREAARIKMEVDKHFMKNTGANNERDEDEDENDGDYEEEGEEGDKKLRDGYAVDEDMDEIQYSGEEEEEEDDDEEEEEGRNGDVEGDDGDDENELDEDAVGISKNTRTTGFDAANSSDEEESVLPNRNRKRRRNNKNILMDDDEVQEQITAPKKPEPKNSITNFFNNQKTKTALSSDAADTEGLDKDLSKGATKPLSRLVKRTIELDSSDTEMNIEQENEDDEDSNEQNIAIFKPKKIVPKSTLSAKGPKEKSEYVEEEAQESEDEFYGQGGPEADENDENLDEYEQDGLLVERNEETDQMDEATLRAVFNKDMEERDKNMTQRLMNDITGGGLRRRLAAKEAGLMLEDYDFYDDDDMDLVAIRRAASAKRRKMLQEGGNQLEALAKDPKTAAFAKAAMPLLKDEEMLLLSDGEEEEPEEPKKDKKTNHLGSEDEESEDEETNEDKNVDVIEGEYDGNELFRAKRANILATSGFSEGLGDNDDLFLNRGYGGSKDDVDDWTVRFSAQVQIETKRSGVNAIEVTDRTKSLFKNPSKLEKFHGLLSEANGVIGGSSDTGGRKGFGAPQQKERGFVNTLGPTKDESAKPQEKRKKRLLGILGRAGSFT